MKKKSLQLAEACNLTCIQQLAKKRTVQEREEPRKLSDINRHFTKSYNFNAKKFRKNLKIRKKSNELFYTKS